MYETLNDDTDNERSLDERLRAYGVRSEDDDLHCHHCGTGVSINTSIGTSGWNFRAGTCIHCSYGDAARVVVDPDAIPDSFQKRLEAKRRSPQAQSTIHPARFLDRDVPAGVYDIRRVTPYTIQVQLPDGASKADRQRLADRYKEASKVSGTRTWYVGVAETHINLVDFQFGTMDEASTEYADV